MMRANFDLAGKRALVTGAGRGIGRGVAEALASAGAEVVLCARSSDEIKAAADNIRALGGQATTMACDVTDTSHFADLLSGQQSFDIFVNNAGTNRPALLDDVTEADFDAIVGLNLKAAVFAAQAVARQMQQAARGGSIINMSSQMGHIGAARRSIYCASKWAIEGFSKALAIELGPHNIRVNTVCPTFIETPLTKPYFEDPAFHAEVIAKIKLGRLGQVQDIVGAVVFLASDASSLTTGSAVMVDGGWTAE